MREIVVAASLAFIVASSVGISVASAQAPNSPWSTERFVEANRGEPLIQNVQYGDRRGDNRGYDRNAFRDRSYWDRSRGRGYYDRTYGRQYRDNDSAIAAGFLGFVLGAAITGSANERAYADSRLADSGWVGNCSRRFRSFDPGSGTYLGYDGYRHYCR